MGNGKDAVLMATQEWKLQIILLDLGLKGQNSLRLVKSGKKEYPEVKNPDSPITGMAERRESP